MVNRLNVTLLKVAKKAAVATSEITLDQHPSIPMSNDKNKEFMLFTLSRKCVGITHYILNFHDMTAITTHQDKAGAHKDKMAPASKCSGMIPSLNYLQGFFKSPIAPYNCIFEKMTTFSF